MNKIEFVQVVAKQAGVSRSDSANIINSMVKVITKALKSGDEVKIHGLGKFTLANRAERVGHNPQTGESLIIKAHKTVKFSAFKDIKEYLNAKS